MAFYQKQNWRTMRQAGKRRDKSYLPDYEVTVADVKFEVLKIKVDANGKPLPKQKRLGQMVLTYSTLDRDADRRTGDVELKLPIVSVWVSPADGEVVKAHLTAFKPYVDDIGANFLEVAMFYRAVLRAGQATVNRQRMTMIASSQTVMRYGRHPGETYQTTDSNDGDYVHRYYYDSKAFAIAAILQRIKDKQMRNIGGVSIASFNAASDDLLIQMGFVKVNDCLGRGLPMWCGDPDIFKDAERDSHYDRTGGKKKLDELLNIFLGGLQQALHA